MTRPGDPWEMRESSPGLSLSRRRPSHENNEAVCDGREGGGGGEEEEDRQTDKQTRDLEIQLSG